MSFSSYVMGGGAGQDRGSLYSGGSGIFKTSEKKSRYNKFSDALAAAAGYKQKARAEAEAKKDVEDEDDEKNTQGFKISPDATVIEGYRDPGYTIAGQPGRSFLGPLGNAVSIFAPVTGQAISAVGGLTGY